MHKIILIACFLLLAYSVKSERQKCYRIKYGSINYFISNRANNTFINCHYYFEDYGNSGFIKIKQNDSSITNYLVYNKRLYQFDNDSILFRDTFLGVMNIFFNLRNINIPFRVEDSIRPFGVKFIKINNLRIYTIHQKWKLTRKIRGTGYLNYKGLVLSLGGINIFNDLDGLESAFGIVSKRKKNKYRRIKSFSKELNGLIARLQLHNF